MSIIVSKSVEKKSRSNVQVKINILIEIETLMIIVSYCK